ncbi:MAG: hypothetical protein WBV61_00725 [Rhodanobacteraceae bacterium]
MKARWSNDHYKGCDEAAVAQRMWDYSYALALRRAIVRGADDS